MCIKGHNPDFSDYTFFSLMKINGLKANSQNIKRERQSISMVILDLLPVFRRTLNKMIRERIPHAKIVEADDFDRAHEVIRNQSPDIVFLDIAIFPKNGIDYIRTLKSELPKSVIVVLTTHDSAEHEAAARSYGADYFFSKTDSSILNLVDTIEKIFL